MTGARILITGAGGFVAGHVAAGLSSLGYRVIAVDRAFDADAQHRLAGCEMILADLAQDGAALPPADVMLHGAALTTAPEALGLTAAEHVRANTQPLLALLCHAAACRARAFVFLSSSGIFAQGDGVPDLTDTTPPTAQGPYSAAKRAGEELVAGALGDVCEIFCLRLGYIYGPGERVRASRARVSLVQGWLETARAGGVLDTHAADPRRDWTWAPDLAPAIARLLGTPGRVRPIHLCAPDAPRDSAVAGAILRHFPAATTRRVAGPAVKGPMVPSALTALAGFEWTTLADGIAQLARAEVAA